MIVFAAITPHSPMLIPSIGKEHAEKLTCTKEAMERLAQELYIAKPDTLVIISPHATMYPDAFSGNISSSYKGVLKEFGDHGTMVEMKPDSMLSDRVHRQMRELSIPYTLTSSEEIDFGYTVPLYFLASQLKNIRLLPIAPSLLTGESHVKFGQALKDILHAEASRVAVIASADLSHHANQNSPEGYKAEGEAFDKTIRAAVSQMSPSAFSTLDDHTLEAAGQCGYRPILMLLSVLEGMNATPQELCYEAPFGVGYLTANFALA